MMLQAKGIYIVGACGFDSVPADVGQTVVHRDEFKYQLAMKGYISNLVIISYKTTFKSKPKERFSSYPLSSVFESWLPDGCSQIFRSYAFGPSGLKDYSSATLRCKI